MVFQAFPSGPPTPPIPHAVPLSPQACSPDSHDFLAPSGLQQVRKPATSGKEPDTPESGRSLHGVRSIAERRVNPLVVANGCARTLDEVPALVPMLDLAWGNLHHDAIRMPQMVPLSPSTPSVIPPTTGTETTPATTPGPVAFFEYRQALLEAFDGALGSKALETKIEVDALESTPPEAVSRENERLKQEIDRLRRENENIKLREENERLRRELEATVRKEASQDLSTEVGLSNGGGVAGNPQCAEHRSDSSMSLTKVSLLNPLQVQQMQPKAQGAASGHHMMLQQQGQHIQQHLHRPLSDGGCVQQLQQQRKQQFQQQQQQPLRPVSDTVCKPHGAGRSPMALALAHTQSVPAQVLSQFKTVAQKGQTGGGTAIINQSSAVWPPKPTRADGGLQHTFSGPYPSMKK